MSWFVWTASATFTELIPFAQVLIWTAPDLLSVLLYTTAYLHESHGSSLHLIYSEVSQGVLHFSDRILHFPSGKPKHPQP